MSIATKSRPALQPASGTFRWLHKPDDHGEGGALLINGTPYLLSPVRDARKTSGKRLVKDRPIIGWKLVKSDGMVYDLHFGQEVPTCDCPDYIWGRDRAETPLLRSCKHLNCLKVALPLAGLPLFGPEPEKVQEAKSA